MIFKAYKLNPLANKAVNFQEDIFEITCTDSIVYLGESLEIYISKYSDQAILMSSNPEVIDVSTGKPVGISEGDAKIYCTYGNEKTNEISLKCIIKIENITISEERLDMTIGEEKTLTVNAIPENATIGELTWTSSNENVATVKDGIVKALQKGETIIKVFDIVNTKENICKVKVMDVPVTSVSLDETSVNIGVGQKYILLETIKPNDATNKTIKWESSDPSVIDVDNGNIIAVSKGQATVTVTSSNGKTASCKFNVTNEDPNNSKKYGKGEYNIRSGPGSNYVVIDTIQRNDEIEILLPGKSWSKVRTSNGTVRIYICRWIF